MPKALNALLALSSLSAAARTEAASSIPLSSGADFFSLAASLTAEPPLAWPEASQISSSARPSAPEKPSSAQRKLMSGSPIQIQGMQDTAASPLPYTQYLRSTPGLTVESSVGSTVAIPPGYVANCLTKPNDDPLPEYGELSLLLGVMSQAQVDFIAAALTPYGIHGISGCNSPVIALNTNICGTSAQLWANYIDGIYNHTTATRITSYVNEACIEWNRLHPSATHTPTRSATRSPKPSPAPTRLPGYNCIAPGGYFTLVLGSGLPSDLLPKLDTALEANGLYIMLGCPYPVGLVYNDTGLCGGEAWVTSNYDPPRGDPAQSALIYKLTSDVCAVEPTPTGSITPSATVTAEASSDPTFSSTASSSSTSSPSSSESEGPPANSNPSNAGQSLSPESIYGIAGGAAAAAALIASVATIFACRTQRCRNVCVSGDANERVGLVGAAVGGGAGAGRRA